MGQRRMFALTIVDSDAFLDLPATSQLLYFHLTMRADDDGFVNKPKAIMRLIGSTIDDLINLTDNKFIIEFSNGVVVIKHWNINNYIQKDRHTQTKYQEEMNMLILDENKSYKLKNGNKVDTQCIHNVSEMDNEVKLSKVKLIYKEEDIPKGISKKKVDKSTLDIHAIPPTIEEIKNYISDKGYNIDPNRFFNFYESKGWMVGKNKMKNWRCAIETWRKDNKSFTNTKPNNNPFMDIGTDRGVF